jgi:hypothetical protein
MSVATCAVLPAFSQWAMLGDAIFAWSHESSTHFGAIGVDYDD